MENSRKPFIVFEGADGVGKTSQIKLLTQSLKEEGYKVYSTAEPTRNTLFGKEVRNNPNLTNLERTCLMLADRAIHVMDIKEYLAEGYVVICDRYYWSSIAYNARCDISRQLIGQSIIENALIPDFIFYLNKENVTNSPPADDLASVLETETVQTRVKQIYQSLVENNTTIPLMEVNADLSKEFNQELILKRTKYLLNPTLNTNLQLARQVN